MNESVYSLIPDEYVPDSRPPRYHSKHNAAAPPSYTTFPKPSTIGRDGSGAAMFGRSGANMGREVGHEINPKRFLKAGEGHKKLPDPEPFSYGDATAREKVPSRADKPVMGLKTEKNFVTANAVEVICTAPKRVAVEQPLAMSRPSFGKTPKYLERVRGDLDAEKHFVEEAKARQQQYEEEAKAQYLHQLPEAEKTSLLTSLRERWEAKHKLYQALPFARDTAMQIARKEALEKEMKEVEDAMAKLNKKVVYVYRDAPGIAEFARSQAMREAQATALKLNELARAGLPS